MLSVENDPRWQAAERVTRSSALARAPQLQAILLYVVRQAIMQPEKPIHEPEIARDVLGRKSDFKSIDDNIVRVQMGHLRKKLDLYFSAEGRSEVLAIAIPVGSYVPIFTDRSAQVRAETSPMGRAVPNSVEGSTQLSPEESSPGMHEATSSSWLTFRVATVSCLVVLLVTVASILALRIHKHSPSALEVFWAPILSTPNPALICLAEPVLYRPTGDLYERYSRNHPGTFESMVDKNNNVLPLDPNEKIAWKDMEVASGFGVAGGDVRAAASMSALFARIGKPSQVRIGNNYTFEDLRSSPVVVVGAFNNKWTMDLTSNLHFGFDWKNKVIGVVEQVPAGRRWVMRTIGPRNILDYGIVTRLLDSRTGQFFVAIAGVGSGGTQAASEFISTPEYLEKALKAVPGDWSRKNMQFVIETNEIDSIPGPPRVVAVFVW